MFNINKIQFQPTQRIYVFCIDLRTNSDHIPIYINWLVFITDMERAYRAVRNEFLNII